MLICSARGNIKISIATAADPRTILVSASEGATVNPHSHLPPHLVRLIVHRMLTSDADVLDAFHGLTSILSQLSVVVLLSVCKKPTLHSIPPTTAPRVSMAGKRGSSLTNPSLQGAFQSSLPPLGSDGRLVSGTACVLYASHVAIDAVSRTTFGQELELQRGTTWACCQCAGR